LVKLELADGIELILDPSYGWQWVTEQQWENDVVELLGHRPTGGGPEQPLPNPGGDDFDFTPVDLAYTP
jgi:hypothetical protein